MALAVSVIRSIWLISPLKVEYIPFIVVCMLIQLTVDGWSRSFRYRWADVLGQTLHNRRGRERTCRDRRGHLRHLRTGVVAGREDSGNRCPTERIDCDETRR